MDEDPACTSAESGGMSVGLLSVARYVQRVFPSSEPSVESLGDELPFREMDSAIFPDTLMPHTKALTCSV